MLTPKEKQAMGIPIFKTEEEAVKFMTDRVIHILTELGRTKEITFDLRMYKKPVKWLYRQAYQLEEERLKKGASKYQKELFA